MHIRIALLLVLALAGCASTPEKTQDPPRRLFGLADDFAAHRIMSVAIDENTYKEINTSRGPGDMGSATAASANYLCPVLTALVPPHTGRDLRRVSMTYGTRGRDALLVYSFTDEEWVAKVTRVPIGDVPSDIRVPFTIGETGEQETPFVRVMSCTEGGLSLLRMPVARELLVSDGFTLREDGTITFED